MKKVAAYSINLEVLDTVKSMLSPIENDDMEILKKQMVQGLAWQNFENRLLAEKMFELGYLAAHVKREADKDDV